MRNLRKNGVHRTVNVLRSLLINLSQFFVFIFADGNSIYISFLREPTRPTLGTSDFLRDARTKKRKVGVYAMKRVAAGAHLPTPWLFEPAKRPDEKADYCLGCNFLP